MSTISRGRVGTILRQRLVADVAGLPLLWGLAVAGVVLLVGGVALFRPDAVEVSGWEQASRLARWYAGAVGVYVTAVYLPLYISHGFTRREFAAQVPAFLAAWAAAFAVLMTAGYGLEHLAYRAFDWPQGLTGTHLFDVPTQYPLVFAEHLLVGAAWAAAGAVLGGAFYRNTALGLALIPVALTMVGLVEAAVGPGDFAAPWPGWLLWLNPLVASDSVGLAALVTVGAFAIGLALTWAVIRDLPMRSRAA